MLTLSAWRLVLQASRHEEEKDDDNSNVDGEDDDEEDVRNASVSYFPAVVVFEAQYLE
ncbi:uncharacterized protein V6R79_005462 [Siganus canaliculatus]